MSGGPLYTPEILGLATELARWPLTDDLPLRAERRSPTCGSSVVLGLRPDDAGRVMAFGIDARACALGQASAAVLAGGIIGRDAGEIARGLAALEALLQGAPCDEAAWPGLPVLSPVKDSAARQPSVLLPWQAALAAMSVETR